MLKNGPVVEVEVKLPNGEVYVVKQPVDGLTYSLVNQLDDEAQAYANMIVDSDTTILSTSHNVDALMITAAELVSKSPNDSLKLRMGVLSAALMDLKAALVEDGR